MIISGGLFLSFVIQLVRFVESMKALVDFSGWVVSWVALIGMDWSVAKYWDCCAYNLGYLNDKRCYFYQLLESVCDSHNL
jgi:hypothetical protein